MPRKRVKKAVRTKGVSPKVPTAAGVTGAGALIVAFLVEQIDTSWDISTEQAIFGGLVTAALAAAGAYFGKPGKVEVEED